VGAIELLGSRVQARSSELAGGEYRILARDAEGSEPKFSERRLAAEIATTARLKREIKALQKILEERNAEIAALKAEIARLKRLPHAPV
jgi:predicted RNase H-like nuclease (RuvC/YqgF family)